MGQVTTNDADDNMVEILFGVIVIGWVDVGEDAMDGHVAQRVFKEEQLHRARTD